MIEPQNTMLPLADSRPVDAPPRSSDGFGAMLAQSLGLIPQVDPSLVQQIDTGEKGKDEGSPAGDDELGQGGRRLPGVAPLQRSAGVTDSANAILNSTDPARDRLITPGPKAGLPLGESTPTRATRFGRADLEAAVAKPVAATPETVQDPSPPIDTARQSVPPSAPVLGEEALVEGARDRTMQPAVLRDGARPSEPEGDSEPTRPVVAAPDGRTRQVSSHPLSRAPGIDTPDVAIESGDHPPVVGGDGLPNPRQPAEPANSLIRGERGATSRPPAPDSLQSGTAAAVPVPPTNGNRQRITLAPDVPVRLDAAAALAEVARPAAERAGTAMPEPASAEPLGTVSAPVAESATSTPAVMSGDVNRPQASVLAERVMHAIELQRNQPPPRSMVVDIPELEGLRLVVSVRSAGHVTVAPAGGSANPAAFAPFAADLSRVLAERGFVMNGDGRGRGHNPYAEDEQAPAPMPRSGYRRPVRADDDLRI